MFFYETYSVIVILSTDNFITVRILYVPIFYGWFVVMVVQRKLDCLRKQKKRKRRKERRFEMLVRIASEILYPIM